MFRPRLGIETKRFPTYPNSGKGIYTGLFGISIWKLLGMN